MSFRAPATIEIPQEMRERAAGVSVVEVKYFGAGRQQKVERAFRKKALEAIEELGERASAMADRHEAKKEAEAEAEEGTKRAKKEEKDPLKKAFAQYPPILILQYHVVTLDSTSCNAEKILEWSDDCHLDVIEFIAEKILRRAELVDETEAERGKESVGLSAV